MLYEHQLLDILFGDGGVCSKEPSGWRSVICPIHVEKKASGRWLYDSITGCAFICLACGASLDDIRQLRGLGWHDLYPNDGQRGPFKSKIFNPEIRKRANPSALTQEQIDRILNEAHDLAVRYSLSSDPKENPILGLEEILSTPFWASSAVNYLGIQEAVLNEKGEMVKAPRALMCEKDANYNKIGANCRYPDWAVEMFFKGTPLEGKNKINHKGMPRGLTYADDWDKFPGPLFHQEGATDPAILYAGGRCTVGRPGVRGGKDHIPEFDLRAARQDRKIVYVVENDKNNAGLDGSLDVARISAKAIGYDIELRRVPDGEKDTRQFLSKRCDFRNPESIRAATDEFVEKIMSGEAILIAVPHPIPTGGAIESMGEFLDIDQNPSENKPQTAQITQTEPDSSVLIGEFPDIDLSPLNLYQPTEEDSSDEMSGNSPTTMWRGGRLDPEAPIIPPEHNPLFRRNGYCPKGVILLLEGIDHCQGKCACIKTGCEIIYECEACAARHRSRKYDECCSKFSIPISDGAPIYVRQLERSETDAAHKACTRADCSRVDVKTNDGKTYMFAAPKTEDGKCLPHKIPRLFEVCENPYTFLQKAMHEFDTSASTPVTSSNNWEYKPPKKAPQWRQKARAYAKYARTVWSMEEDLHLEHGKLHGSNIEMSASGAFPPDWTPEKIENAFKWWAMGRRVPEDGHAPKIGDYGEFAQPKTRKSA